MTTATPVLLGVRHHGPGSARAVRRALSAYRPDVVLIEGPPEADALVPLAGEETMRPPVALLAYPAAATTAAARAATAEGGAGLGGSGRLSAAFWPFAEFSPEWQAIRWAVANDVPVRFADLPAANRLALDAEARGAAGAHAPRPATAGPATGVRTDPIAVLAAAAGYDDPERWWEDAVEHRLDPPTGPSGARPSEPFEASGTAEPPTTPEEDRELAAALAPFQAIGEAMREVRACAPDPPEDELLDERRREAHLRQSLRAAVKAYRRVAVVCGAWHVPALTAPLPPANADARVLRGLPKVKTATTWVPWTYARLASWQGYGAGVTSPGWYHHLFTAPDHPVARWLAMAAAVLRRDGAEVSSAHIIEATRLAEALATMRGRPLAGLAEVTDAVRAVLCDGDELRLALVNRRLVVGDRLGHVPDGAPAVPLARDVTASQRRLRLPPEPLPRDVDLDLRRDLDLERSRLLHRLRLLGVDWGETLPARRGRGTFWESWKLAWQPEFAVDLVAAGGYGTTVVTAATTRVAERAAAAATLADVTALVEQCLLADLPPALPGVLAALDDRVALDHDVAHLMAALPALARTLRYGDVRGTDTIALRRVATGLVTRICIGLPGAVHGLDDSAAATMRDRINAVHASVALLGEAVRGAGPHEDPGAASSREEWYAVLGSLSTAAGLPGLLAGRVNRLLLDAGRLAPDETGRRMAITLTVGVPVPHAAAWVEGFLAGDGVLLIHDQRLLGLVDRWLSGIPADAFLEVLPLLRRTFSEYPVPQRRQIGERAARLGPGGGDGAGPARPATGRSGEDGYDAERGSLVLATVSRLLGHSA